MRLKQICDAIEEFAPLAYQESYDNSGLLCGDYNMEISSALLCIDSTEEVVDEAIAKGCNLIIAHHPIVFSGLKRFTGSNYIERTIIKAIKNDIAIYVAHTNLDNVKAGVNSKIAAKLGLVNTSVLAPKSGLLKKLMVFVPEESAEKVRSALFSAGAGHIGNYSECSFNTSGTGTFNAENGSNPYVGSKGVQHHEKEIKIETVFPAYLENALVNAMINNHPYEEVAYDLVSLANKNFTVGSGLVGELKDEMDEKEFLKFLKQAMKAEVVRYTSLSGKKVKRVAVCGGSGSFLLEKAIKAKADVFVTADFKYHQFFDSENQIVIVDIGHYESEQFTVELFYEILKEKFNTFALLVSGVKTNPINYI
jgi:dinuclear metal center YbgI/SA1388 family protein